MKESVLCYHMGTEWRVFRKSSWHMPRSKAPNKVGRPQGRRPAQTRKSILIAARNCFAENGYDAPIFKQVAKRAGLTPAALYTHFSSKPDLFLSTIAFSYTPLLPGFKAIFDIDAPFKEKLRTLMELAVDLYEDDRITLAFIVGAHMEAKRHPKIADYEDKTSLRNGVEVMLASLK